LVVVFSRHAARDGGDEAPPSTPYMWPREFAATTAPLGLCLVMPPQRWLDGGTERMPCEGAASCCPGAAPPHGGEVGLGEGAG
jgi:hypothetical protein